MTEIQNRQKILYVYDFDGWALHNVGVYWASLIADKYHFTFVRFGDHTAFEPSDYRYIFFGCSLNLPRFVNLKQKLARLHLYPGKWLPYSNDNFITVVHDPCELYPQSSNWTQAEPYLKRLEYFSRVSVISNQMQELTAKYSYRFTKINTTSLLPPRESEAIANMPLKAYTRANDHPRKNLELAKKIQSRLQSHSIDYSLQVNPTPIDIPDYIKLIDNFNCYICTSWQEGGPLPIADAMRRGCVVLTTPVGQTDEWVTEGVNGFFCTTEDEFLEKLLLLKNEPELLLKMRRAALDSSQADIDTKVRDQLLRFLD